MLYFHPMNDTKTPPSLFQRVFDWYQGPGKTLINEVPFLSSLIRDGFKTSEGSMGAALVGLLAREALKADPNPWALLSEGLGLVGVGIYAHARGSLKAAVVATEAESDGEVDPVKGFLGGSN